MTVKTFKTALSIILITVSFGNIIYTVITHSDLYRERYDTATYKKYYEQSQWVDPHSKKTISDEQLYTYAADRYIHGENPVLINPEVPPIGKYIIGLSITTFQNQRYTSLIFAIASLLSILYLTYLSSGSMVASSIAVFLTATHSLFIDQIIHAPQLDIFQLFFFLLAAVFYIRYLHKKQISYLVLTGIALGFFISVKIFFLFYTCINIWLLSFYVYRKIALKTLLRDIIILNVSALMVFVMSYTAFFLHGGTIRSFLGSQKWIFYFYASSPIQSQKLVGSYLGLILLNKWRVWSTGYPIVSYSQWDITWPILFIYGTFATIFNVMAMKKNCMVSLLVAFLFIYNILLCVVPIFPRYLLLLYVPFNIMIGMQIATLHKIWQK